VFSSTGVAFTAVSVLAKIIRLLPFPFVQPRVNELFPLDVTAKALALVVGSGAKVIFLNTETVFELELATKISGLLSASKSPTNAEDKPLSAVKLNPVAKLKL